MAIHVTEKAAVVDKYWYSDIEVGESASSLMIPISNFHHSTSCSFIGLIRQVNSIEPACSHCVCIVYMSNGKFLNKRMLFNISVLQCLTKCGGWILMLPQKAGKLDRLIQMNDGGTKWNSTNWYWPQTSFKRYQKMLNCFLHLTTSMWARPICSNVLCRLTSEVVFIRLLKYAA